MNPTRKQFSLRCPASKSNLLSVETADFLEKWGLSSLKMNLGLLEGELLTRVTTQHLAPENCDERTAVDSAHAIFPLTREILGRHCSCYGEFAKLAIQVLNQIIRPFTARWHRLSLAFAFQNADRCLQFRAELAAVQPRLRDYTRALAAIAQIEDLTALEEAGS